MMGDKGDNVGHRRSMRCAGRQNGVILEIGGDAREQMEFSGCSSLLGEFVGKSEEAATAADQDSFCRALCIA